MIRHLIFSVSILSLGGCSWLGNYANTGGSFMPVAGERCENWQCMTDEGKAKSNLRKAERQKVTETGQQQTQALPPALPPSLPVNDAVAQPNPSGAAPVW